MRFNDLPYSPLSISNVLGIDFDFTFLSILGLGYKHNWRLQSDTNMAP